jgi:transcriptional regulator with XRE-family HTH domain
MTVGQRIAYYRKRRGYAQQVLAGFVGKSTSWLQKVEKGERTVDKVSVLQQLANVLEVGLGDLIGGVELPPNGGEPLDPPRGLPELRHALLGMPEAEPLTAMHLRTNIDYLGQLVAEGFYEARALLLPGALAATRVAAEHEVAGAWWGLARLYQMASGLLRRTGDPDLALVAADRAVSAALRSEDDLMVATARRRLALARMREGWLDDSGAVCSDAADAIAPTDATSGAGWSLWGSLLLTQAVAAARKGDVAEAWRLLRHARAAADRVGPGRNDYWENFGPANVSAHEVVVALELGDPAEALRAASRITIAELSTASRRADVLIDIAHARLLRHDKSSTVGELVEAERHAPELVRYSMKAREMVGTLLRQERGLRTPGLKDLAERMEVAA